MAYVREAVFLGVNCPGSNHLRENYPGGGQLSAAQLSSGPIFLEPLQSCKLYNYKEMTTSIQITNNEIFAFIAVLVLKLLSRKVLFVNRKDNGNC